jgi:hypothetical protein
MGATSVTGVGSNHQTLGVSHLIGPRWTEEKEKELAGLKKSVTRLWLFNLFANLAFFFMAVDYYLLSISK